MVRWFNPSKVECDSFLLHDASWLLARFDRDISQLDRNRQVVRIETHLSYDIFRPEKLNLEAKHESVDT